MSQDERIYTSHGYLSPEKIAEARAKYPNKPDGPHLLAVAHQMAGIKARRKMVYDAFAPVLAHITEQTQASPDLAKRATCARLALVLLLTSRRESNRNKMFDQIRRMYGHDASSLNIEPQLPTAEILAKWKKDIESRGIDNFDVIEAKVVNGNGADRSHA